MAGLQAIKNRIGTIHSIRKITNAMQLISSSKLRRVKTEYENIKSYNDLIEETFKLVLSHLSNQEVKEYFPFNQEGKRIIIVISSDLGLAGSYNSNILKLSKKTILRDDLVILIGLKAIHAFSNIYDKQILKLANFEIENQFTKLINDLKNQIFGLYRSKKIKSVSVIYNKYLNNLVQKEVVDEIFPFALKNDQEQNELYLNNSNSPIEFEPSAQSVLDESIPLYLSAKLYTIFTNAKLSEMASRRMAMETATDNADNLINDLNLKYNRKRQSNITQEINEIVAGADAV